MATECSRDGTMPRTPRNPHSETYFIPLRDMQEEGVTGNERHSEKVDDSDFSVGESESAKNDIPYPALAPRAFFFLQQTTPPRSWCLRLVCNPWFERVSVMVIVLNCLTLGMYQPCENIGCNSQHCKMLKMLDHFIFAFFALEMFVKMLALGVFGKKCYFGDPWNCLDCFIVLASMLEYSLDVPDKSLSAIRTVRVLRPLRAINRVPSMRILVTLLLDTLPMLGNVLLLCFFIFFVFGIVAVQLWAGLLRNRCFMPEEYTRTHKWTLRNPFLVYFALIFAAPEYFDFLAGKSELELSESYILK